MEASRVCWPEQGRAVVEPFTPRAPGPGEVLVETEVSLISPGTERAFFLGLPNAQRQSFPSYPGYCNIGRVAALGDGVESLQAGDRVASPLGHASHGIMRVDRCWPVPDGLGPERAVYCHLGAIALQGVRRARVELGESVMVLGLGLVGNLALQLAGRSGAQPLIGLDTDAGRREIAERCGADVCLDPSAPDAVDAFARATGGSGAAVVIEATGSPEAVNDAFLYAGMHGRVVLLASTRGVTETNFYRDVHKKGLAVYGAHNAARPPHDSSPGFWTAGDDTRTVLRLLAAGRLHVDPLTTETLPSREAARAYEWLASWRKDLLGILLRWQ
jgi:2-desacetyl-2-hydroxyethyl bacteriochlorophyllide A dehydrogenase